MEKQCIKLGIGFVTGRPNACEIINKYHKKILEQVKKFHKEVSVTIFILYDIGYQQTEEADFYKLEPQVYKELNVKYITPENIEEDKKILKGRYDFSNKEVNYILGHGHAKGRNTLMYYALKKKMDYLLFWDDDEYPVACLKNENGDVNWKEQDNILKHLEAIEDADISIGYHCGYISPIPYLELDEEIDETVFKSYIEAVSNEIVDWDSIKKIMKVNNGVTYANPDIASGNGEYEIGFERGKKWVAGSTLCVNLRNINKIPAFYNPPDARGEDTFFSMMLDDCKVIKTPLYHFHDGFLKYKCIMSGKYPKKLRKIESKDENVGQRFLKASAGWLKYKPLLLYIQNKKNYKDEIQKMRENLEISTPVLEKIFPEMSFKHLLELLEQYDGGVQKHYKEFIETNKVWNKIKSNICNF